MKKPYYTRRPRYYCEAILHALLTVGLLFTSTSIFTGPLVKVVGGIDLSFTSSAVVGALFYYILLKLFPSNVKELDDEVPQNV